MKPHQIASALQLDTNTVRRILNIPPRRPGITEFASARENYEQAPRLFDNQEKSAAMKIWLEFCDTFEQAREAYMTFVRDSPTTKNYRLETLIVKKWLTACFTLDHIDALSRELQGKNNSRDSAVNTRLEEILRETISITSDAKVRKIVIRYGRLFPKVCEDGKTRWDNWSLSQVTQAGSNLTKLKEATELSRVGSMAYRKGCKAWDKASRKEIRNANGQLESCRAYQNTRDGSAPEETALNKWVRESVKAVQKAKTRREIAKAGRSSPEGGLAQTLAIQKLAKL